MVGTFAAGWLLGAAAVWKLWDLTQAGRFATFNGLGQMCFMLIPVASGVLYTRLAARLAARGWGWPSVRAVLAGVVGLFLGLLAL